MMGVPGGVRAGHNPMLFPALPRSRARGASRHWTGCVLAGQVTDMVREGRPGWGGRLRLA
ncbi:hypothetical protein SCOCK_580005 [Actinacidiphila cocklensis]|uniref:Uncharacterized protein n=1 Tax=Actinacidiphila cocklensis TaxID=887465 RepID=A0A9W4E1W3_9ACTN|nr:hypothetical protein SCOCK_580005 [Actinacidiphila cocklensis]